MEGKIETIFVLTKGKLTQRLLGTGDIKKEKMNVKLLLVLLIVAIFAVNEGESYSRRLYYKYYKCKRALSSYQNLVKTLKKYSSESSKFSRKLSQLVRLHERKVRYGDQEDDVEDMDEDQEEDIPQISE